MLGTLGGDVLERAQRGNRQRVEARRDTLVVAIGGEKILHEVVRADRQEVGAGENLVELPEDRGHLDHDAQREFRGRRVAELREMALFALDEGLRGLELCDRRYHREHDAHVAAGAGLKQRP